MTGRSPRENIPETKRVLVVVLGDIGRSPRMQNHCKSFVERGNLVALCGYTETEPDQEIISDPRINIYSLVPFPDVPLPRIIKYFFKIFWSAIHLLSIFFSIKKADVVMLQNPPGIPSLALCYLYCKIRRAKFIIDWHNYTWSIMALESSTKSFTVKLARLIEGFFGRRSDLNFCVTKAMKQDLYDNYNIKATVLYDRPSEKFQKISLERKHQLFQELSTLHPEFKAPHDDSKTSTAFTSAVLNQRGSTIHNQFKLREGRPGLLVSSTSWTADEDFQILLDALIYYDNTAKEDADKYPKLICAITGKGPLKSMYEKKIADQEWKFVKIVTPWLKSQDYPLMIASADLGVCLHFSSSGLDLPMKVVDMFGCGLPACAMNFKCLSELVVDGQNGFVFNNATELGRQLTDWFYGFPSNIALDAMKDEFSKNLQQFQSLRWKENWENIMALQNIIGLLFPLGVAITIGDVLKDKCALAIGLFYRDRTRDLSHNHDDDFISEFYPEPGFDTKRASSNSTERNEEEKCCICLEVMKRYQCVRTLPCVHKFHKKCVDHWLRYDMICPTCRTKLRIKMDLILLLSIFISLLVVLLSLLYLKSKSNGNENQKPAEQQPAAEGPQLVRNQRRNRVRAAEPQVQQAPAHRQQVDSDDETPGIEIDEKMGAKKRAKLEAKAEKRAQREAELKAREEQKKRDALVEEERKKQEEKEALEEQKREEAERKAQEERERREHEEYLKMKAAFEVQEEGFDEEDTEQDQLLQNFIDFIKTNKVVVLEDLAAQFKMKTQAAIDRIVDLQKENRLSGVIDDRGKFIFISEEELKAVAKFIKQRGRVSISELAEHSNTLINFSSVTLNS
ncbi:CLUMA_CG019094, isoform A [Clunio marinus]|uniref:DDRGK domain-containing protein 1 n=1 Tax=Clunio marinus TaxID=568069 RepID=A0A1J1J1L7_9DIPT|nr:CLUMA_CG019094, isoform A [Clunio marinus]